MENHWYFISRIGESKATYICRGVCIEPYKHRTGYWQISDPQHPEHVPEELPPVPGSSTLGTSTLSVPRQHAETLESQELSPFRFAENSELEQEEYFSSVAEATTDILVAQFHSILDIRDREPENPLTPDQPAYLHLVEEAVEAGLNVPPPPPLIQEPVDIQPVAAPPALQIVIPAALVINLPAVVQPIMAQQGQQVQQQAQQQQAAPQPAGQPAEQVATDKLRGSIPETFNGDRRKSQ